MYKKQKTMKKSQLRKIIRESINQLMREQQQLECYGCVNGVVAIVPQFGAGQPGPCGTHPQYGAMHTDPSMITGCGGGGTTTSNCPTCDPTQWPNMQTWINSWTTNNAFTPPMGINQPCQHICNRLDHWENKCLNAGPEHKFQLSCKIQEGQNQAQIHYCSC